MESNGNADVEIKKKRGRKPKTDKVVTVNNANNVKETENPDPQLLHLNICRCNTGNAITILENGNDIKDDKLYESDFCKYDPEMKIPNAYNECDNFSSQPFELTNAVKHNKNNVKVIMTNIDNQSLTNVVCYWCCHKFDTPYLGLPMKCYGDKFEVIGCFCSFECMCAYNFNSNENNNIWETYNLINIMANKMNYERYVYPAPPRKCLTMFGGYMTIDEFRNFKNLKKIINVNKTPLVVLVDQIEEINDYYHSGNRQNKMKDVMFDYDHERIAQLEDKMNKQNSKHLSENFQNTLDAKMNISAKA